MLIKLYFSGGKMFNNIHCHHNVKSMQEFAGEAGMKSTPEVGNYFCLCTRRALLIRLNRCYVWVWHPVLKNSDGVNIAQMA